MKNRFKLDFGIQYAQEGSQFIDVPLSTDNGGEPGVAASKYKYCYIEFSLNVNCKIISGSFVVNGIVGLSSKYFIGSHNVNFFTYDNGQKDKIIGKNILTNPNKVSVNALLGIGTYYFVNDRLQFNIEPIFRISLVPLDKSSIIKQYNYSIGVFKQASNSKYRKKTRMCLIDREKVRPFYFRLFLMKVCKLYCTYALVIL